MIMNSAATIKFRIFFPFVPLSSMALNCCIAMLVIKHHLNGRQRDAEWKAQIKNLLTMFVFIQAKKNCNIKKCTFLHLHFLRKAKRFKTNPKKKRYEIIFPPNICIFHHILYSFNQMIFGCVCVCVCKWRLSVGKIHKKDVNSAKRKRFVYIFHFKSSFWCMLMRCVVTQNCCITFSLKCISYMVKWFCCAI